MFQDKKSDLNSQGVSSRDEGLGPAHQSTSKFIYELRGTISCNYANLILRWMGKSLVRERLEKNDFDDDSDRRI